ncbi:MAG: hypothetical protein KGD73_04790 [Candidatus Lokiarchaeota archaeon]|nr:hypothetical protein [Candidatus Lokiarchaeota archaeon]
MSILYLVFLSFLIIFVGVLIVEGIFFVIKGINNKLINLIIIGIGFISLSLGFIGNFVFNLNGSFQEIFVFISFTSTTVFTNLTFYKNRKKIGLYILFSVICLGLIQLIIIFASLGGVSNIYYLRVSLDVPYTMIVFNWMAWASYSSYKKLKNEDIQPWIKIRYKLIAIFSFIISFNNIPEFFQPKGITWGDPSNPISLAVFGAMAILAVIFSIGFGLAWLMPKWFKNRLNKGYKTIVEKDLTEQELITLIEKQLKEKRNNK